MALAHAILALLIREPMSGYDLNKNFERSVGSFWKATHQQIYRELSKMEDQGLVAAREVAQEGRPDKKLYSVTQLGKETLALWIAEPCEVAPVKDELLVKVFVGSLVPVAVLKQEIERHRQRHQNKLTAYRQTEADYFQHCDDASYASKLQYLVLRRGIAYETDWIAWCDEVLQFLNETEKNEGESSLTT